MQRQLFVVVENSVFAFGPTVREDGWKHQGKLDADSQARVVMLMSTSVAARVANQEIEIIGLDSQLGAASDSNLLALTSRCVFDWAVCALLGKKERLDCDKSRRRCER